MSSIDDLYNQVARDYGRKSYRTADEDSFREFMKKKTIFMFDASYKAPFSEFEKPYFEDDYTEMEQMLQNPPGLPWDWTDWPFDNPSWPPQELPPFPGTSLTVFWCSVSGCWCEETTRTVTADCSHEITDVHISELLGRVTKGFSINTSIEGTTAQIEITADEDPDGSVHLDFDMDANGIKGSHEFIMVSSCSDCDDNCEEAETFEGDSENNPTTVTSNSSLLIYVLGGVGPFDWTVDNPNATLDAIRTVSRANRLRVQADACGGITVTVTDHCEEEAEIALRVSDDGRWLVCWANSPIDGITCYTCRCGPCFNDSTVYLSATQRRRAFCAAIGCDGPVDCAQWKASCALGPRTCADYFHPTITYYFPCYDPCGSGGYTLIGPGALYYDYWSC